jgi:hypothetical protein
MGQNTLTIFIIHFLILYGSLIGIGLNDFFYRNLNPWQSFFGAVLFISFHSALIYFIDDIKSKLKFILDPISKFWGVIYKF